MIRRNCRSLLRFGAVAAALLLALPALADEIEPEPYVEEEAVEPEPEPVVEAEVEEEVEVKVAKQRARTFDKIFDVIILRPFGLRRDHRGRGILPARSVDGLPKRSGRRSGRLGALRGSIGGAHLQDTARRVIG